MKKWSKYIYGNHLLRLQKNGHFVYDTFKLYQRSLIKLTGWAYKKGRGKLEEQNVHNFIYCNNLFDTKIRWICWGYQRRSKPNGKMENGYVIFKKNWAKRHSVLIWYLPNVKKKFKMLPSRRFLRWVLVLKKTKQWIISF